jgi:hypothetical protein
LIGAQPSCSSRSLALRCRKFAQDHG